MSDITLESVRGTLADVLEYLETVEMSLRMVERSIVDPGETDEPEAAARI
jgi:hypothetical protein